MSLLLDLSSFASITGNDTHAGFEADINLEMQLTAFRCLAIHLCS